MSLLKKTFGKEERLKSRKKIQELFSSGKIIHHHPFKALYLTEESTDNKYPAQLAVSVSKRNFKKAVQRNAIKRKIREAYRVNKTAFYQTLRKNEQIIPLFVIYTAKEEYDFHRMEKEMKDLMKKIIRKVLNETTPS